MKVSIKTTLISSEDNEDGYSSELTTSLKALCFKGSNTSLYHYTKPRASSTWSSEVDVQAMSKRSHTPDCSYGFV